MNKKGFISISVIYSFFIVFLMLLLFIVNSYANNRALIKKISAKVIEEAIDISYCEANVHNKVCNFYSNYNPSILNIELGDNNMIYYHSSDLVDSAGDGSYRFAGPNPNNYVCFGSDADPCPANNLYRIIGIIPVEAVIDENEPEITEIQMLYKLIKNDYLIATEANTGTATYNGTLAGTSYSGPNNNQFISTPQGYYWSGQSTSTLNTWPQSKLNTQGLNIGYLNSQSWSNLIATVTWKIGGNTKRLLLNSNSMNAVYTNEIMNSGIPNDIDIWYDPTDMTKEITTKVGLLYISDFGYAVPNINNYWKSKLDSEYYSNDAKSLNWLYRGVSEWTITRCADTNDKTFIIDSNGGISNADTISGHQAFGVRPTFFLKNNIRLIVKGHLGTVDDPYRIDLSDVYD